MSKLPTDVEDLKRLFREKGVRPVSGGTGLYVKDKVLQCDAGCAVGALLKGTPWDSEDTAGEPESKFQSTYYGVYNDYAKLLGITCAEFVEYYQTVDSMINAGELNV